jgi:hypothetical protein
MELENLTLSDVSQIQKVKIPILELKRLVIICQMGQSTVAFKSAIAVWICFKELWGYGAHVPQR